MGSTSSSFSVFSLYVSLTSWTTLIVVSISKPDCTQVNFVAML